MVLFVLLILEVSFRIMYSLKYHNFRYMTYGLKGVFKIDIDQLHGYKKIATPIEKGDELFNGFRTAPFSIKKPKGEYRIVALGESSTYGLNIPYEKSWPYLLEKNLNGQLHDYKYRVINAGIPGQTPYELNKLLSAEVLSWEPDMVILYTLYNHIDIAIMGLYSEGKTEYLWRLMKALFYEKSLLVTHMVDFISFHSGLLRNMMDKYRYLLTEMIKKCKHKNVEIVIVKQLINPDVFDSKYSDKCRRGENVKCPGIYYDFLKIIDEVCAEYNCILIDFSASSPVCRDRINLILEDNIVHMTDYGNELLADVIAKEILKMRS